MQPARRILAGLDVGVFGGLLVLAWFALHSWLSGDFWWTKNNVAGGWFFGSRAFSMGFGRATLAGSALILVVYGIAGVAAAFLIPMGRPWWLRWFAILLAVVGLHWFMDTAVWRWISPFAHRYFTGLATFGADFFFGLSLFRLRHRYRALEPPFELSTADQTR